MTKPGREDLIRLRLPLAAVGIALLVALTAFGLTHLFRESMLQNFNEAQSRQTLSAARLQEAVHEQQEISLHYPQYKRMTEYGLVGEEQRLAWVETLQTIRQKRRIHEVAYEISAQKPFDLPETLRPQGFDLRASRMQLNLEMLHEEDLTAALQDLREARRGVFILNGCEIERHDATMQDSPAQLKALCTLDWLTVVRASPAAAETPPAQ